MTSAPFTPRKDTAEARAELRDIFPPGSTAATILRHVSSSGMTRWVSVIGPDCQDVTWLVAAALEEKIHDRGWFSIKVPGVGMDAGFSLIYQLSHTLYRDGYPCQIGTDNGHHAGPDYCPSNHHVNGGGWTRTTEPHTDGYAISQRWM